MKKVKSKKTKPTGGGVPVGRDQTNARLPDVLAKGGDLDRQLTAAEEAAGEDDRLLATIESLREALGVLREECEKAIGGRPLEPARRDRVCAHALADMAEPKADAVRLVRLIVVMGLVEEPPEGLWAAGLEAYRQDRAVYDTILGDSIPEPLRTAGAVRDYRDNANPTALGDWQAFADQLHQQRQAPRPGMATGLAGFDARTGGLYDLALLGGEPAGGKTCLALQLAVGAVRAAPSVAALYVDLEMGKHTLYLRLLSQESGVPLPRIVTKDRTADDDAAIKAAAKRLKAEVLSRFKVVDLASARRDTLLTRRWFKEEIERLLTLDGVEECLVVVDSINRMGVEDAVQSYGEDGPTRFQRLSELDALKARMEVLLEVQRMTRAAAGPAGFPVLAVARCRKPDRRGSLELADLYGGADLGYDAQSVYLLERHDSTDPLITPVTLKLAKVREWGSEGEIELDFHHTVSTFVSRNRPAAPAAGRAAKTRFNGRS